MKKLLLTLLAGAALSAGAVEMINPNPSASGGGQTAAQVTNIVNAVGSSGRMIYVAPWGSDAIGTGTAANPFRTVYDALEIGDNAIYSGAFSNAVAGDTIVLTPDVHWLGAIPLPDNVNLWIQPGAVVIRTNFANATVGGSSSPLQATLDTIGPLIIPGQNSIIDYRGATLICTNGGNAAYDGAIGWLETVDTYQFLLKLAYTNMSKSNVKIWAGNGIGSSDFFYFVQTNTAQSSVNIYGGKTYAGWDSIRADSNIILKTFYMDIFSTNTASQPVNYFSRGAYFSGREWTDVGSSIGSGGGTNWNSPIGNSAATVYLYGTRLYRTSSGGYDVTNQNNGTTAGNYISSGVFSGSASLLTSVPASALTGYVPSERLAPTNSGIRPGALMRYSAAATGNGTNMWSYGLTYDGTVLKATNSTTGDYFYTSNQFLALGVGGAAPSLVAKASGTASQLAVGNGITSKSIYTDGHPFMVNMKGINTNILFAQYSGWPNITFAVDADNSIIPGAIDANPLWLRGGLTLFGASRTNYFGDTGSLLNSVWITDGSLTASGTVSAANGHVLPQSAVIPTNSIPASDATTTNWVLLNLTGTPTLIATNYAAGGWLQKALWP